MPAISCPWVNRLNVAGWLKTLFTENILSIIPTCTTAAYSSLSFLKHSRTIVVNRLSPFSRWPVKNRIKSIFNGLTGKPGNRPTDYEPWAISCELWALSRFRIPNSDFNYLPGLCFIAIWEAASFKSTQSMNLQYWIIVKYWMIFIHWDDSIFLVDNLSSSCKGIFLR